MLKSGVYVDESVSIIPQEKEHVSADSKINYRIWILQMVIWCMIVTLSKIIVFFFEVVNHRPIVRMGEAALSFFEGNPRLELVVVMIAIPVSLNSVQFWVQDNFLKGDKHIEKRKEAQTAAWFAFRAEAMKAEELDKHREEYKEKYDEVDNSEESFVLVVDKPNYSKSLSRTIEEGVFNITEKDRDPDGNVRSSVVEPILLE